jgi:hypothetical protein
LWGASKAYKPEISVKVRFFFFILKNLPSWIGVFQPSQLSGSFFGGLMGNWIVGDDA